MLAHRPLLVLLGALALPACVNAPAAPDSRYQAAYHSLLRDLRLDPVDATKPTLSRSFAAPVADVWQAVLKVVPQYSGVVSIDDSTPGQPSIVFVHAKPWRFQEPPPGTNFFRCDYLKDCWLRAELSEHNGETRLQVFALPADLVHTAQAADPALDRPAKPRATVRDADEPVSKTKPKDEDFVALALPVQCSLSFLDDVQAQCLGPALWETQTRSTSKRAPPQARAAQERDELDDTEVEMARWVAKDMRRAFVYIDAPAIQALAEQIVDDLRAASGTSLPRGRVSLIASPVPNAFAASNGDIYITSGLLDVVGSRDELAAAIAHEHSHYLHHDQMGALWDQVKAGIGGGLFMMVGVTGMALSSATMQSALYGPAISQQVTQSVWTQVVTNATQESLRGRISSYSVKQELAADREAVRLMKSAGYDPLALVSLLEHYEEAVKLTHLECSNHKPAHAVASLQERSHMAEEANCKDWILAVDAVAPKPEQMRCLLSSFFNCKPGTGARIEGVEVELGLRAPKPKEKLED